ncbi:Hypothetical predicted protein [Olea europaea subsp. europaea]|uniref:Uncharacterized protein n=1 Tax=Olea europaea subsp. europaea TaxID=158383 RepID=A0A8S0PJV2_OLEEU|nr:Hypothetical predicted protein [Olea europaea subsp. europaea]
MKMYRIEERLAFEEVKSDRPLKSLMFRNSALGGVLVMVIFTLSLLVLPLVLPPLPPPPPLFLLVPVLIMAMLIFLAFSPSQVPNVSVITSV